MKWLNNDYWLNKWTQFYCLGMGRHPIKCQGSWRIRVPLGKKNFRKALLGANQQCAGFGMRAGVPVLWLLIPWFKPSFSFMFNVVLKWYGLKFLRDIFRLQTWFRCQLIWRNSPKIVLIIFCLFVQSLSGHPDLQAGSFIGTLSEPVQPWSHSPAQVHWAADIFFILCNLSWQYLSISFVIAHSRDLLLLC